MTHLDAIEKYGPHPSCDFCFFGIIVEGLCTKCDGTDKIDKALKLKEQKNA